MLAQLDEEGNTKEGGIQVEAAVLMPAYMKNDDQKAIFANAKVNVTLNVKRTSRAFELSFQTDGMVWVPVSYTHLDVYKRQDICFFF